MRKKSRHGLDSLSLNSAGTNLWLDWLKTVKIGKSSLRKQPSFFAPGPSARCEEEQLFTQAKVRAKSEYSDAFEKVSNAFHCDISIWRSYVYAYAYSSSFEKKCLRVLMCLCLRVCFVCVFPTVMLILRGASRNNSPAEIISYPLG